MEIFQKEVETAGKKTFVNKTKVEIETESYEIADAIPKKTDFAFDIMIIENWAVPKYIKEGLTWLEK